MPEDLVIPEAKYVPKAESNPNRPPFAKNFADNDETMKKIMALATSYYDTFKGQSERDKFEELMDTADEMIRVGSIQTQLEADETDNQEDTKTQLTSPTFYRYTRTITAWENTVMLGTQTDLPVECEIPIGARGIRATEAKPLAEYRNMELQYVFDKAKLRDKISDWNFFVNKNSNLLVEAIWNRRVEERWERVPRTGVLENIRVAMGKERRMTWKKSKKVICDWPDFIARDFRNTWYDLTIQDIKKQSCIIVRDQVQLGDLWQMQRQGEIINLDKLKEQNRTNIDGDDRILNDRKTNADELSSSYDDTKLFDVFTIWIRAPIDVETGIWDEKRLVPTWNRLICIGEPSDNSLGVSIEPDPYNRNEPPYLLWNIKRDDKGALHMGNVETTKGLIEVETSLIKLAVENVRKRNRKPWIMERGSVSTRSKVFVAGGNQIWTKMPGTPDPHEVEVQDTTAVTIPLRREVDGIIQDAFGLNPLFMPEALGGRTSATEASFIADQAVKVALEDLTYKANQLLPWMAEWILAMMDMFADEDTVIAVTKEQQPREVKPKDVWGDVNIRVTCIKKFQDSMMKRKEENQFINQIAPLMLPAMSPTGKRLFFGQIARNRGWENVNEWWGIPDDYDAKARARDESNMILWEGQTIMPKSEENHEAHLSVQEPILDSYVLLPADQQNAKGVQVQRLHNQMHQNFLEQKAQAAAAITPTAPQAQNVPAGQEFGQTVAAEAGAAENMGAPV